MFLNVPSDGNWRGGVGEVRGDEAWRGTGAVCWTMEKSAKNVGRTVPDAVFGNEERRFCEKI